MLPTEEQIIIDKYPTIPLPYRFVQIRVSVVMLMFNLAILLLIIIALTNGQVSGAQARAKA